VSEVSIRFGVGDGRNRRAATWKCWAHRGAGKNDVYLACRELRGALKASLHQSGQWHVSFAASFLPAKAVAEEWPTRFVETSARPNELSSGFTLAYRIVTPYAAVNAGMSDGEDQGIVWIPPPAEGHAVETIVAFTHSAPRNMDWPGRRSMGTDLVGAFSLDNGHVVWIIAREITPPAFELSMNDARYFHGKTSADVKDPGVRGIVFRHEQDGSRSMWEIVDAIEEFRDH
jgi:hypothetical protein